jgi:hypothetical protein
VLAIYSSLDGSLRHPMLSTRGVQAVVEDDGELYPSPSGLSVAVHWHSSWVLADGLSIDANSCARG